MLSRDVKLTGELCYDSVASICFDTWGPTFHNLGKASAIIHISYTDVW